MSSTRLASEIRVYNGLPDRSTIPILVVDDHPPTLSGLVILLRQEGYAVRTAASYQEAARQLTDEPPMILITDIRLGAYNGLQLVARARVDQPDTAAIVVTAYPDPVLAHEARKLGAEYVVKPATPAELLELLRKVAATVGRSTAGPRPA